MADQFQTGVCGETWCNSGPSMLGSSACSSTFIDIGSFGWPSDLMGLEGRCSYESESVSDSDGSVIFQDIPNPQPSDSVRCTGNISMDSTMQMMDIGLPSSTTTRDWNQDLYRGIERAESNYQAMLRQELNTSLGFDCPRIEKDRTFKSFPTTTENQGFSTEQQPLNFISITSDGTQTCQGLSASFPVSSSAPYDYNSTLLRTLYNTDPQPQSPVFESQSMNCFSMTNCQVKSNELLPSCLPKFSSLPKPSLPKQQPLCNQHFSDNKPFWIQSTVALDDIRASHLSSPQSPLLESMHGSKPNCADLGTKINNEQVRDSAAVSKKSNNEPPVKRPRIASPLPTFKVRKEKLGDRVTALQQLVSPFGKTDTASVLHEAIDYIKFLHDQVIVLSTPYMKNGTPIQCQQKVLKGKDEEGHKKDLKSRGLCLVPLSSTFPIAAETTADFWTRTFGATFR